MSALFGPHAAFIAASYGIAVLLIGGISVWTIHDHKSMSRKLARIDPRQMGHGLTGEKNPPGSTTANMP